MTSQLRALYIHAAGQLDREARVQAVTDRLSPAGETRQETIDRIVNEKIKEMFSQPLPVSIRD